VIRSRIGCSLGAFGFCGLLYAPAAHSQSLIAQAKVNPRVPLAAEIQKVAFEFANNPEDYSLVEKTEELTWKMIRMSEGLSSCAMPSYSLPQSMQSLNTSYVMMVTSLNQLGNVPESIRDQTRAQYESSLNGQKKWVAKVLDQVMKYCK
jgi:hypothetical protein